MTTIKETGINVVSTPVEFDISIIQYDAALESIIGSRPTHALLLSSVGGTANALFDRGCIYFHPRNELWTTSAPLAATDPTRPATILMSKVTITAHPRGDTLNVEWAKLRPPPAMPMPASGCVVDDGILWCSQGTMQPGTGGVFHMPAGRPPKAVVTSYYGRDFNSPHSAAYTDSGVWFTDPCCGHDLDFRSQPQLPPSVYRYDRAKGEVRAMADGFVRPTGLAVDEDSSTLYVADSGGVKSDGSLDLVQPRSVYAFDIVSRGGAIFLANKRLFSLARRGAPQHIMCEDGNVWAACGDGIEIWNSGGSLLGLIKVTGGVSSFCRGPGHTIFMCAEQRLWRLEFPGARGRKASLDLSENTT
ncbi:SMP-30/Gluconolaconase/LRE-like region containing protein [Colletotrichum truncatum]|uniref:SMP-30/Gluconolaconase/LRE-like region containing protein n=1 Tax=Colletotrichum truncatum TaxID=5467 RepID=A0ACC3YFA0_COLTU